MSHGMTIFIEILRTALTATAAIAALLTLVTFFPISLYDRKAMRLRCAYSMVFFGVGREICYLMLKPDLGSHVQPGLVSLFCLTGLWLTQMMSGTNGDVFQFPRFVPPKSDIDPHNLR